MSAHRWEGPTAGGEDDGVAWQGYVCERCGRVAKRTSSGKVIAWATSFLGTWAKRDVPLPQCDEPARDDPSGGTDR